MDTWETFFREKSRRRAAKPAEAPSILVWCAAAAALLVFVTAFIMLMNMMI